MATTPSNNEAGSAFWSSRLAFILAATGSAVGLGNIWGFPYKAGENGGGAFVLVYLLCVVIVGLPIMMSEILIGRQARKNPVRAMEELAIESGRNPRWGLVGKMGVAAGFLILSFYSVIAGWTLAYVFRALGGEFAGIENVAAKALFNSLIGDAERSMAWHTIFMVATVVIVSRGLSGGLEKMIKILMPTLFLLLLVLVGISTTLGDAAAAIEYLFVPDFSQLTAKVVIDAMGQAFFSLSLGMGAIMMYGAYLPDNASVGKTAAAIMAADTAVALIAGLAIFPLVFAIPELSPNEGTALVFIVLPQIFGQIDGGGFIAFMFFLLLFVAGLTSAISLLEPVVSWLVDHKKIERTRAARTVGFVIWLLGLGTVFSFSIWADQKLSIPLRIGESLYYLVEEKTIFDLIYALTFNFMLPLGGVLIAYFAGFVMKHRITRKQLPDMSSSAYRSWLFLVRNITPIVGGLILLNVLGLLDPLFLLLGIQ